MNNINGDEKIEKPENEMTFEERKQKLIDNFENLDEKYQILRKENKELHKIDSSENFIDFALEILMRTSRITSEKWRFEHNLKELNKDINKLSQQEEQLIIVAKQLIEKGSAEIKKEDSVIQFTLDREKMNINVKEIDLEKKMVITENNYLFEEKWLKEPEKDKDTSKKSSEKEYSDPWNKDIEKKEPWEKENDNPWEKSSENKGLER